MCGGTERIERLWVNYDGLSPRVRGNLVAGRQPVGRPGSIPACAGEPPAPAYGRTPVRVYPRVCGGTATQLGPVAAAYGLSPRVRGNPVWCSNRQATLRSIPACAGEPRRTDIPGRPCAVYPRVCGGTDFSAGNYRDSGGLSPRVRGNPGGNDGPGVNAGSIPACAGEPIGAVSGCCAIAVYPRVCGGTR